MSFLDRFFKGGESDLKTLYPLVEKINALEGSVSFLSEDELRAKTFDLKERVSKGETLDALLPEAFALAREATKRTLGQRHYDVQLLGGIVLHQRGIAEMKTGEGKTQVAVLPAYLNALSGKGVHVVTVNDYLSRRDAVWMGQIYSTLGLSVGVLNNDASYLYDPLHKELDKERDQTGSFKVFHEFLRPVSKKEAYLADITYGTNNEFGFDYLRDNLAYRPEDVSQRPHNYAIVDEIDSILIDEARTPLIISSESRESEDLYGTFSNIANKLEKDTDYTVDEKRRAIVLTDSGINKAEKALGVDNIYTEGGMKYVHHLETAVRAKALYEKDTQYVVRDGQVLIVDEFTGRIQPGRRWSEGLHQAIEAKEGVPVQKESRTVASITFQNYFRLYQKLSGMTGTAITSQEEFFKVYGLDVISIPTHRPVARIDNDDLIFQTERGKFRAIAKKVKELNEKGQPVLIGTVSIEKNEMLSAFLKAENIPHEMLNAKNHEREGEIIAQAGQKGKVTVATNMAGRGVDIKLGGNPVTEEKYNEVKSIGGLFVMGTERHEARRIDNQLRGRSGRQGDPGETQFFVSLEDTLMRVFSSDTVKNMMGKLGIPEDEPIQNRLITKGLEGAQERIEGFNFDARKATLEFDDVMNQQRKTIYTRRRSILFGERDAIESYLSLISEGDEEAKTAFEKRKKELGDERFFAVARAVILQSTDTLWMEHLEAMDYLRSSVNLRAYGQRDPLVEYKKEGLQLFRDLERAIAGVVIENLPRAGEIQMKQSEEKLAEVHENARLVGGETSSQEPIVSNKPKNAEGAEIGRNDPCFCGSGKKYKKCHGA